MRHCGTELSNLDKQVVKLLENKLPEGGAYSRRQAGKVGEQFPRSAHDCLLPFSGGCSLLPYFARACVQQHGLAATTAASQSTRNKVGANLNNLSIR